MCNSGSPLAFWAGVKVLSFNKFDMDETELKNVILYFRRWIKGELGVDARMCLKQAHDKYPSFAPECKFQDAKVDGVPQWRAHVEVFTVWASVGFVSVRTQKGKAEEDASESLIRTIAKLDIPPDVASA